MNIQSFINPFINIVPKLPQAILGIVIGYIVIKILLALLNRILRLGRITKGLRDVLISLASVLAWGILISVVTRNLGFGQISATISGSLVVLGLAVATGASSMTSDIIAGIMLAKDEDFRVGYHVKIGDITGIIYKLDMRKVRIKDDKNNIFVIANSQVEKGTWQLISRD
ncbi:MAG: mechanosensitive ion channel domain-containing protein [Patescibacteria group bacterium]|jgi:small-conductance mechanosensitive channel